MAWTKFPHQDKAYIYTAATLKKNWARLHIGDCEPFPENPALVEAWIAFHAGDFEKAAGLGLEQGVAGWSVANKAICIYTNYLEENEKKKLAAYQEVAKRCEEHQAKEPKNPAAYHWHAYALGRYAQGISIVAALKQGIAGKVKASLDMVVKLAPKHADAHIALGTYNTAIIDGVGTMIGKMTYGVTKDDSVKCFKKALELNPGSAIGRCEFADSMVTLDGDKKMKDAVKLYEEAAACTAVDAMERLDVEMAKAELEDE